MTQINNIYSLKRFMDKFSKKVLTFINTNDSEISTLRNKVARDIANAERNTDSQLKNIKGYFDDSIHRLRSLVEIDNGRMKSELADINVQLMKMETKEVIREYIDMKSDKLKYEINTKIDEERQASEKRLSDVYNEMNN